MTNKEFKRLKRADLIEIIYCLQENEDKYRDAISRMKKLLEDRQTKIDNAGSIAEAAMSLSNVFESAQDAADRYLSDIQRMHEEAMRELENAKKEAVLIIAAARQEAAMIKTRGDTDESTFGRRSSEEKVEYRNASAAGSENAIRSVGADSSGRWPGGNSL